MFSSIRTCEANRAVISALTSKLQLGTENVIARLALAYSLSHEQQLNLKEIKDSKGKEYSKKVLFGDNLPFILLQLHNSIVFISLPEKYLGISNYTLIMA